MKKFSKFVHVFKKDDVVALYYALSHETIYLKVQLFNLIQQSLKLPMFVLGEKKRRAVEEAIRQLTETNFLVDRNDNEKKKVEELKQALLQPGIYMLFLLLTDACNLGCTYCFIEEQFGKRPKPKLMSLSTAKRAVNLYAKCLEKTNSEISKNRTKMINFYGGEPLINKAVLVQILEYIEALKRQQRLPSSARLSLNTNGTLIDEKIASILKKHNVEVGISIDGPREYHDTHRKYWHSQKGSFDEAVKAYHLLKRLGVSVGVSCTVPEQNVDALPDIFKWFIEELSIEAMGFNPLLESQSFKVQDSSYPQRMADAMIECYKIARKAGLYEDRMMRKVKAFVGRYFYDRDCSATGRQIVVGPDGRVGTCAAFYKSGEYFVQPKKKLEDFDPYSHLYWQKWARRLPINFPKCLECPALGICGGGCPYNAQIRHGSIWKIDDFFCPHAVKTLKWLIWDLYEQSTSNKKEEK